MPGERFRYIRSGSLVLLGGALLGGCGSESPTAPAAAIRRLELAAQVPSSGTPGLELADSVRVRAVDAMGNPVAGAPVRWMALDNGAVTPGADTSDANGMVAAAWRLGPPEGTQILVVDAGNAPPLSVEVTATTLHAVSLTSGNGWNCALDATGRALCWGLNRSGQLGRGRADFFESDTAVEVSGGLSFTMLTAAKSDYTCGLDAGGTAYCWGYNQGGALGSGAITDTLAVPTPVATGLRFTDLSANGDWIYGTTCGRTAQGEVWCWGSDVNGLLGDSTLVPGPGVYSIAPVRVQSPEAFARVKVGFFHSCALSTSSTLWCWGVQHYQIGPLGRQAPGTYRTPIAVAPLYHFLDLAFGDDLTCGLSTSRIVYCWGIDWFGSLGAGGSASSSADPLQVAGSERFVALANAGSDRILGLSTTGGPYFWGSPGCCDLSQSAPLLMDKNLRFEVLDGQADPYDFEACGITSTGAVYCRGWGNRATHGVPVRGP